MSEKLNLQRKEQSMIIIRLLDYYIKFDTCTYTFPLGKMRLKVKQSTIVCISLLFSIRASSTNRKLEQ
jgi:hypothetical protein